jgi:hypothetical protein
MSSQEENPKVGTTKEYLPLAPHSPGVTSYIYVGHGKTESLLEAFKTGPSANVAQSWEIEQATQGWIMFNNNGDEYWHGGGMGRLKGKKHTMTREEFMEWWANHQLMLSIDYWTMDQGVLLGIIQKGNSL